MRTAPNVLHRYSRAISKAFIALLFLFVANALVCLAFAFASEPRKFFVSLCTLVGLCLLIRALEPHVDDADPTPKLRNTGGL